MEHYRNLRSEHRKRIVDILVKGLSRCVDNDYKSRTISNLTKNKDSRFVAYELDIPKDKSVSTSHENQK